MKIPTLGVYRVSDERFETVPADSPLAPERDRRLWELHNRRKDALHAAFDSDPNIRVTDWKTTDDSVVYHEFVTLPLSPVAGAVFHYAIVPGLTWLALKLAEKAVETSLVEFVKAIVAKLRPKQESKQLGEFIITLPDKVVIHVEAVAITINFADGSRESALQVQFEE